ncbi:UNVERIFIED_CONTAM: hypothetical protein Sindi_2321300 [Sesamum indicum]
MATPAYRFIYPEERKDQILTYWYKLNFRASGFSSKEFQQLNSAQSFTKRIEPNTKILLHTGFKALSLRVTANIGTPMTVRELGTPCKVDVEYEWLPPKCTDCMTLGHSAKECTLTKPQKQKKPPVKVYVPKVNTPPPTDPEERQLNHETVVEVEEVTRREEGADQTEHEVSSHNERGKAVSSMLNIAIWNVRGLNKRDHQLALKDLASEYRLYFMGILETRVLFLLPHWKWFVDYASVGNRIWVAWDENEVDVHILEVGNQFMHCRVTNRADSESIIITVVYGASEIADRRSLWSTLDILARQCTNDPWLVGGDFNAVRDMNEVCGASGDIRIAIEEFNASIQVAGLLPLPMHGFIKRSLFPFYTNL